MKKVTLLTIAILPIAVFAASTGWARYYYPFGRAYDVKQTDDGCYIIASGGGLTKADSLGHIIWQTDKGASGVQVTNDGGFIQMGSKDGIWLVKSDSNGNTMWERTYQGRAGEYIQQTNDGGYIVTGEKGHLLLLKTDAEGNILWERVYGDSSWHRGFCVEQTTDNGYIITGWNGDRDGGWRDVWLLKTDANGDTLWTKLYGGESSDEGYFVQATIDGGYIIHGGLTSFGVDNWNDWLIKTNSNGDTLWTRNYQLNIGSNIRGNCVRVTQDGGYIIAGITTTLIKTDKNGDSLWTRDYIANSRRLEQTHDGGYIIAAGNWLYKTDVNGDIGDVGVTEVDSLEDINYGEIHSVKATVENFGRTTEAFHARCIITFRDLDAPEIRVDTVYWDTIFVDSLGGGQTRVVPFKDYDFPQKGLYWMYATTMLDGDANPYNDYASSYMGEGIEEQPITQQPTFEVVTAVGSNIVLQFADASGPQSGCVAVYDATGRLVDEIRVPAQGGTITWGEGYGPGVYFIRIEGDASATTHKVILIH